jgi:FkbM family methyltransferase
VDDSKPETSIRLAREVGSATHDSVPPNTHFNRARFASLVRRGTRNLNVRGVPRLLYITRRLTLGGASGFFEVDGVNLYLDPDDYFQCMMFYGRYSPEILDTLTRYIHLGDTVLDIGAHVGYFTFNLSRLVGHRGSVVAFEPDVRARARLGRSVTANAFSNVVISPLALSATEGELEFFLSPVLGWSTAVRDTHLTGLEKVVVKTAPLDLLIERGEVSNTIQFIKMDIEGFEVDALRGMEGVLRKGRPMLLVEVNEPMLKARGESPATLGLMLESFGYRQYERLLGDILFGPA